jgi:Acetyltransferase (GNAT) family
LAITWAFASPGRDGPDFARFQCWNQEGEPWVEEVENYIRVLILTHTPYVIAFRDEEELVAVSGFFPRQVAVPLVEPEDHDAWHLEVVAVRVDRQRTGVSAAVLESTFQAMRQIDSSRALFTVKVHEKNAASLALCTKLDLTPFPRDAGPYLELLGEVPEG